MRTKFRNHKTFNSEKDAQDYKAKKEAEQPNVVFQVKRKTWPGKLKVRFTVRSIVRRGYK
jgi:hypothetical protein